VAVYQMAGDVGSVLGPVVTGWVADAAGYGSTFAVCAAVCAIPVFAVLAAPETLQHQVDVSTPAVEDAARDAAT
jgi:dipeptide/tripeptide permease